jgi:hypothetical protein
MDGFDLHFDQVFVVFAYISFLQTLIGHIDEICATVHLEAVFFG